MRLLPFALLMLGLTACSTPQVPQETSAVTEIRGTVSANKGRLPSQVLYKDDSSLPTSQVFARASVDSVGKFALTLPPPSALNPASDILKDSYCTGSLTSSDAAARGASLFTLYASYSGSDYPASLLGGSLSLNYLLLSANYDVRGYVFADRATTLSGTVHCGLALGLSPAALDVQIKAKAGWNPVRLVARSKLSLSGGSGSGTLYSSPEEEGTWTLLALFEDKFPKLPN